MYITYIQYIHDVSTDIHTKYIHYIYTDINTIYIHTIYAYRHILYIHKHIYHVYTIYSFIRSAIYTALRQGAYSVQTHLKKSLERFVKLSWDGQG